MDKPFVITIVGAESSGKTTLAMKLAEYFACPWVPEYAREYLEGLGRAYNEEDLGIIATRQLEEINKQLAIGNEQRTIGNKQLAISNKQKTIGKQQLATGNRQREDEKNRQLAIGNKQFDPNSNSQFLIKDLKSLLVTRYSSFVLVDGGMMNMRMWARIKYNMMIPVVEEAL
ncbi:MAG: AAA family ATPase, partial [Saprospiraceae bacterium]